MRKQSNQSGYPRQQMISSQQEKSKTSQINSEEQTLKYNVRTDFLNVIGIALDFQTGLEYLKDNDEKEQLITMLHNRLILQINLSSSVHYDQSLQCSNSPQLQKILREEKIKINHYLQTLQQSQNFDNRIKQLLNDYSSNCLGEHPKLNNKSLLGQQKQSQLNENIIQKLIDSMCIQDQIYRDLLSGKNVAEELSQSQIDKYIQKRINDAKHKIQKKQDRECICQLL